MVSKLKKIFLLPQDLCLMFSKPKDLQKSEKLPENLMDADLHRRYKEKHMYLCITS